MPSRLLVPQLLVCAAIALPVWAQEPLSRLGALTDAGARISALVVDLDERAVIAALNPGQRLTPASVTKLYTTAAALRRWGPDHRFVTRLASAGSIEEGVLHGDLVLVGAGDPGLDHADLWRLVARLRQRGVTRIEGNLVVNDSLFGPVACLTLDRCQAQRYSEHSYDAPLSAAGVNFSNVEITVIPADTPGQPANLVWMPPALEGFDIAGEVLTVKAGEPASLYAWRSTAFDQSTLTVAGQVPVGSGRHSILRSVSNPSLYTGKLLAAILKASGIAVTGEIVVDSGHLPDTYAALASVVSPPLANQLRTMLTYSNNYMADVLTLDLLAYDESAATHKALALPRAAHTLEGLAQRANKAAAQWLGQTPTTNAPLTIDTGSGLSITNRLSARDIVSLLAFMYHREGLFPSFLGSLPVPKYTPSGTLKNGNRDWSTRMAAKTGTLTEPVTVRALAGYLRLEDGHWGAFAVLINGSEQRAWIPFDDAMQALRGDLEDILAQH